MIICESNKYFLKRGKRADNCNIVNVYYLAFQKPISRYLKLLLLYEAMCLIRV